MEREQGMTKYDLIKEIIIQEMIVKLGELQHKEVITGQDIRNILEWYFEESKKAVIDTDDEE